MLAAAALQLLVDGLPTDLSGEKLSLPSSSVAEGSVTLLSLLRAMPDSGLPSICSAPCSPSIGCSASRHRPRPCSRNSPRWEPIDVLNLTGRYSVGRRELQLPVSHRQHPMRSVAEMTAKDELLDRRQREVAFKQAQVDKLTHELAVLKRLKFAATSEKFRAGLSAEQQSLLEETLDADIAQACAEIDQANGDKQSKGKDKKDKQQAKREPLPPHLPRREVHHEPESTACGCGCQMKRIGQDIAEKLDYEPGVFTVERHVRGKWACAHCQKLVQASGGRAHHRQGHPHGRAAGARAGGQVPGSLAAVPPGAHLRARRHGDRTLDAGPVGGRMRRAAAAAGGRAVGRVAAPRRAAR